MKIKFSFLVVLLAFTQAIIGCPTCVGRITKNSKPFFSDDFYASSQSMDHLYQAVNEKNEKKEEKQATQRVATNSPAAPEVQTTRGNQ